MKKLSSDSFERARYFLKMQARPLERALFEHYFEGAGLEPVYSVLACFQNPDGGFGHALEPDARTPSSAALPTAIGLHRLAELGCPVDHPLVQKEIDWLLENWNPEAHVWRPVAPDTNDHPHAPWWHDENGSLSRTFDGFLLIPRVLILASLYHYSSLVEPVWLERLTGETVDCIEQVKLGEGGGGSDLEYAFALASAGNLPGEYAERIRRHIRQSLPKAVVTDPARWHTYCVTPLRAFPAPQMEGTELFADAIQAHLDYQIDHQSPDGSWKPTWTWGGAYPEHWAQAEREWSGQITLEMLLTLRAYGRLA